MRKTQKNLLSTNEEEIKRKSENENKRRTLIAKNLDKKILKSKRKKYMKKVF
jgi:hypothetical protein